VDLFRAEFRRQAVAAFHILSTVEDIHVLTDLAAVGKHSVSKGSVLLPQGIQSIAHAGELAR